MVWRLVCGTPGALRRDAIIATPKTYPLQATDTMLYISEAHDEKGAKLRNPKKI